MEELTLLRDLRAALRTEPNVELAVLFGSAARGDDHLGSDLDILVSLRDESSLRAAELAGRLARAVGREVDVVRLSQAEQKPALLLNALDAGRVLVDRGGTFADLCRKRRSLKRKVVTHRKLMSDRAHEILASF